MNLQEQIAEFNKVYGGGGVNYYLKLNDNMEWVITDIRNPNRKLAKDIDKDVTIAMIEEYITKEQNERAD